MWGGGFCSCIGSIRVQAGAGTHSIPGTEKVWCKELLAITERETRTRLAGCRGVGLNCPTCGLINSPVTVSWLLAEDTELGQRQRTLLPKVQKNECGCHSLDEFPWPPSSTGAGGESTEFREFADFLVNGNQASSLSSRFLHTHTTLICGPGLRVVKRDAEGLL